MNRIYIYLIGLIALTLSSIAAYYSILGFSIIFGNHISVKILAGTFEAVKLFSAFLLERKWKELNPVVKGYLVFVVISTATITSTGIFGYLKSKQESNIINHTTQLIQIDNLNQKKIRLLNNKETLLLEDSLLLVSNDKAYQALSSNRIEYTDREGNKVITTNRETSQNRENLNSTIDFNNSRRDVIFQQVTKIDSILTDVEDEIFNLKVSNTTGGELSVLLSLAKYFNKEVEDVSTWFSFGVTSIFDPVAVLFFVLFSKFLLMEDRKEVEEKQKTEEPENIDPSVDFNYTLFED